MKYQLMVTNHRLREAVAASRAPPSSAPGAHAADGGEFPAADARGARESMRVVAATKNPTEPWGRRPYHRPDCREVTKPGTIAAHWTSYANAAAARFREADAIR